MKDSSSKPQARGEGREVRHPVGTAVGGVAGAVAAGAAVGSVAGPVGTLLGAAAGAVAGAVGGRLLADFADPQMEDAFWRRSFGERPYVDAGADYERDWGPAYRYGADAHRRFPGQPYEEIERQLAAEWEASRSGSQLAWEQANLASLDAWQRVKDLAERIEPGKA